MPQCVKTPVPPAGEAKMREHLGCPEGRKRPFGAPRGGAGVQRAAPFGAVCGGHPGDTYERMFVP